MGDLKQGLAVEETIVSVGVTQFLLKEVGFLGYFAVFGEEDWGVAGFEHWVEDWGMVWLLGKVVSHLRFPVC